jgi:hypothetical protein
VTVIFREVPLDDMMLAMRAVKWLHEREHQDAIIAYGEKDFFVRRTKSGFSVVPL